MLTMEGYHKADLQPHADALQGELRSLKADSTFMPQPKQDAPRLSKSVIESRVRILQTSIENIRGVGSRRHADQARLFPADLKVHEPV